MRVCFRIRVRVWVTAIIFRFWVRFRGLGVRFRVKFRVEMIERCSVLSTVDDLSYRRFGL